jgi:hypothetical protein
MSGSERGMLVEETPEPDHMAHQNVAFLSYWYSRPLGVFVRLYCTNTVYWQEN